MRRDIYPEPIFYDRLMANVKITDGCWHWTGCVNDNGYGRIRINDQEYLTHRLSYAVHCGHYSSKLDVCHTCDEPRCVNPEHLFLATHLENMRDASQKKRFSRKTRRNGYGGHFKLSEADVVEIIKTYSTQTISQKELGKRYGVGQGVVGDIIKQHRMAGEIAALKKENESLRVQIQALLVRHEPAERT